jgi:hypothetical protein
VNSFQQLAKHPLKFRMFLISKLPSAYFAGVRVKDISEEKCVVTVPYKWFSQNPFRSTYFACLSMAAEMSTGALGMMNIYKREPKVSMLIIDMKGEFFKKATGITTFVCKDGIAVRDAVTTAIETNESNMITVRSIGTNESGEIIAEFLFTWSFKVSRSRSGKILHKMEDL